MTTAAFCFYVLVFLLVYVLTVENISRQRGFAWPLEYFIGVPVAAAWPVLLLWDLARQAFWGREK